MALIEPEKKEVIMPDTEWEKIIDKMVEENTWVFFYVYSNEGHPHLAGDTLVRDHDYYFDLWVKNKGSEVHFSHLQARCTTVNCPNVQYYSDGSYGTPVSRVTHDWDNVGAGTWVRGRVYFRVTQDKKDSPITHYGLYGTVVPAGHEWGTLEWNSNIGPG
jgi:hypothetical protein